MPTVYRKPQPYRKPRTYRGEEVGVLPVPAPGHSAALRAPWTAPAAQSAVAALPYVDSAPHDAAAALPWGEASPAADLAALGWRQPDPQQAGAAAPWGEAAAQAPTDIDLPFGQRTARDRVAALPWADIDGRHAAPVRAGWRQRQAQASSPSLPWGALQARALTASVRWRSLVARGAVIALPWGPSGSYQRDYRSPWPNDPTDPTDPGWTPLQPPILPVYAMIPTLSAVVLPERTPLGILGCTLSTDTARYLWQCSATIPITELDLVKPDDGPVDIEISVNGYVWILRVTSYSDRRRFGSRTASIEASSRSVLLAQPMATPRSRLQTETRDASQLADEELDGTSWTLLWDTVDWSVPGGTWSYADLAPIEALGRIAASIGARVETDRTAIGLRVAPTYPVSPWEWGDATPWAILPAAILTQGDGSWQDGPNANGVYVYGENGYGAHVLITGTAGEVSLPMRVERLITSADPARESGRQALAAASKIKRESVTLPLFPVPADPGLLELGRLVDVQEGPSNTWRGQVMAVRIDAQRSGSAFSVRQTAQIERHLR